VVKSPAGSLRSPGAGCFFLLMVVLLFEIRTMLAKIKLATKTHPPCHDEKMHGPLDGPATIR
jgi:hypothetical protein